MTKYDGYGGNKTVAGTYLEPPEGIDPDCLLFLGDPNKRTQSTFQRGWMPIASCIALTACSLYANRAARMPYRAGLYKHVLLAGAGLAIGEGGWRFKEKMHAEKDIQFYHYMITHPEDFKAPEKKKWADVIQPWIPMR